jgi:hypothetical protein
MLAMQEATVTGGLTAASTFSVTGSAIVGTGGTAIAGILAGSGEAVFGNINASAASTTSLTVTGLTQNHKVIFSPSDFSGSLTVTDFSCSPGGGVLTITVSNTAVETYTGATETFSYLAILDK